MQFHLIVQSHLCQCKMQFHLCQWEIKFKLLCNFVSFLVVCCLLFLTFSNKSFRNIIRMSNSLDPDHAPHFVGSDLGSICLQRLTADNKRLNLRLLAISKYDAIHLFIPISLYMSMHKNRTYENKHESTNLLLIHFMIF